MLLAAFAVLAAARLRVAVPAQPTFSIRALDASEYTSATLAPIAALCANALYSPGSAAAARALTAATLEDLLDRFGGAARRETCAIGRSKLLVAHAHQSASEPPPSAIGESADWEGAHWESANWESANWERGSRARGGEGGRDGGRQSGRESGGEGEIEAEINAEMSLDTGKFILPTHPVLPYVAPHFSHISHFILVCSPRCFFSPTHPFLPHVAPHFSPYLAL